MKKFLLVVLAIVCAAYLGWREREQLPPSLAAHLPKSWFATAPQTVDSGSAKGGHAAGRRGAGGPVAVRTVAARRAVLPLEITTSGAAVADDHTTIAAQEQGSIESIAAEDGATVKAGDLIATLEDSAARAAVDKDKAFILRDTATLAQSRTALTRAQDLLAQAAGTQQSLDQAREAKDIAAANIDADKATLAADQVALDHTRIIAPFDGRLGEIAVSRGAFVNAGAAIVTIATYDPISVLFHLPQAYLASLKEGYTAGNVATDAKPQENGDIAAKGSLSFFDNTVDAASGTILAKAAFANGDGALWPGESVNVTVHFSGDAPTVVVPTVAVTPGADSPFVYVVGADKKVHITQVQLGRSNGGDTGITSGIAAGDHVIVEGQVQLSDGQEVGETFDDGTGKVAEAEGGVRPEAQTASVEAGQ